MDPLATLLTTNPEPSVEVDVLVEADLLKLNLMFYRV
jgi:hypothetical protein